MPADLTLPALLAFMADICRCRGYWHRGICVRIDRSRGLAPDLESPTDCDLDHCFWSGRSGHRGLEAAESPALGSSLAIFVGCGLWCAGRCRGPGMGSSRSCAHGRGSAVDDL